MLPVALLLLNCLSQWRNSQIEHKEEHEPVVFQGCKDIAVTVLCSDSDFEPDSEPVQPKLCILGTSLAGLFFFPIPSGEKLKQGLQCLSVGSEVWFQVWFWTEAAACSLSSLLWKAVKSFGLGLRRWWCETAGCRVLPCAARQDGQRWGKDTDYIEIVTWAVRCELLAVWLLCSEGPCMAEVHVERCIFHLESDFGLMHR